MHVHGNGFRIVLTIGLLLALAMPASANAGTVLMWWGMGHLLIGNLFIGMIEAGVLARFYQLDYARTVTWTIAANYCSMIVGFILVNIGDPFTDLLLGSQPLYRIPLLMGVMVGITFALSVLLEWPFYNIAFRLDRRACIADGETIDEQWYSRRRILRATLLAQVVSYLLISGGYLVVAGTGFVRHARLAHDLSFAKNPKTAVIYQDNGTLYRIRLDGSVPVRVTDEELTIALGNVSTYDVMNEKQSVNRFMQEQHGPVYYLLPPDTRTYEGNTDFWGTEGLTLHHLRSGERFNLGLELPFLRWQSRNAFMLPGDQVVYQFGPQIVLYDITTRKMAFVAKGRGPMGVLPQ